MLVPNRHKSVDSYRYGFNGKEKDDELMGEGNFQDYGMRFYNPRVGRFFSVDPLTKSYPELTPYQFASNTPIQAIDLDGEEKFHYTLIRSDKGKPTLKLNRVENFTETKTEWKPTFTNWFNTETTTVVNPRREYIVHGIVTVTYGLNGNGIQNDKATWTFDSESEMRKAEKHGGPSNYGGWSWSNSDQQMGTAAFIGIFNAIEAESEIGNQGALGRTLILAAKANVPKWNGPVDYSHLIDSKFVGPGKNYTAAQKANILKANREANGGYLRSDLDGTILDAPVQSKRGEKANMNQAEIDHVIAKNAAQGPKGSNSYNNAQVLSKAQNIKKSNK